MSEELCRNQYEHMWIDIHSYKLIFLWVFMNLYESKEFVWQCAAVQHCKRYERRQCVAVRTVVYGSVRGSVRLSGSGVRQWCVWWCITVRQGAAVCGSAAGSVAAHVWLCGSVRQCVAVQQCVRGSVRICVQQCSRLCVAVCGSVRSRLWHSSLAY
jgi:hypothetical protein